MYRSFLFGDDPPFHALRRQNIDAGLSNICRAVKWRAKPILTEKDIETLNIRVQELDLSDKLPAEPVYFEPLSTAKMQSHPVASDKDSQELLSQWDEALKKIAMGDSGKSALQIAETFAGRLSYEMSGPNRENIEERLGKPLITLTNWRYKEKFSPSVIRADFYHTVFSKEGIRFAPVGVWYEYEQGKVPHMMFSMKHELDWDEDLLSAELYLITSSIRSRMASECTYMQMVIPVMVFSFGARHGRIIQSFYDGWSLIVRKSKLVDLLDPSARPFDVFARFVASKPVGNTNDLPMKWLPNYDTGDKAGGRLRPKSKTKMETEMAETKAEPEAETKDT